jgi:hypothetical protein
MAPITSASLPAPVHDRAGQAATAHGFKAVWQRFFVTAFHPYRPELHYMRGPGPAWRAKYGDQALFRLKSGDI